MSLDYCMTLPCGAAGLSAVVDHTRYFSVICMLKSGSDSDQLACQSHCTSYQDVSKNCTRLHPHIST